MTILSVGTCQVIATSSGMAIPAVVGSVFGGAITGVKLWVHSEPVAVAIGSAMGAATSASAIAGAAVSKTAVGAVGGALVGSISSGGLGSVVAGSLALTGTGLSSSPLGFLLVGTSAAGNQASYDCWKPVVHEWSTEPSTGMMLKDLIGHPSIDNVIVENEGCLPRIVVENVWDETFEMEYVLQDGGKLSFHANRA